MQKTRGQQQVQILLTQADQLRPIDRQPETSEKEFI